MRARLLLLATLVAPTLPAQTQSTFYAAYTEGLEAERRGEWRVALAAFRRAAELRPASAARVITYGNNLLLNYAPHSHLAKCHLELGDAPAAQAALIQAAAHDEPKAERDRLAKALAALTPPLAPAPGPAPKTVPEAPRPEPPHIDPPALIPLPSVASASPAPEPPKPAVPGPAPARLSVATQQTPAGPRPIPPAPVSAPPTEPFSRWAGTLGLGALTVVLAWAALRRRARASEDADPTQVGPYRIERLLGRGGFASTYLARHATSGAQVALKRLHPYRQEDPEFLTRFRHEAQLGTRLDHPNLVRVVDPGLEEGTPWLAMEFISGERLDQRLRREGNLPLPEVLRIAMGVASAMTHAHDLGIVHRDLKPANVMFEGDVVKVMDFGIARTLDAATLTTTYAFLGTPRYAAPEAQLKSQVGPAADRYSFGIMLYELLAGAPPFEGETPFEILDQHRSRPLPDLASQKPELPPALVRLVHQLCAKVPGDRPEDAEILATLEGLKA